MRIKYLLLGISYLIAFQGIRAQSENWLYNILKGKQELVDNVLDSLEYYRVEIIYTRIDRQNNGQPQFTTYRLGLKNDQYRYPASTVKLPVALLAMEELNKLPADKINMHTPVVTGADRPPQTNAFADSTTSHGFPSVAQYVRKILLVSDNDAYNRLYELLGQEEINTSLWKKGYSRTKIVHRLSAPEFSDEDNCWVNPTYFLAKDTFTINKASRYSCISQDRFFEINPYVDLKQGLAYIDEQGLLIQEPFDFSKKNLLNLQTLHYMLQSLFFPEAVDERQRWNLSEEQKTWVIRSMGQRPRESLSPIYDLPDNYGTFLLFGDREDPIPGNIRIFNKVGWAYGYLTDAAYVVDLDENIEFLLSASIFVNKNQIFNDNNYEYESIGLPFLASVGRIIHKYEKQRARRVEPDFRQIKTLFLDN